MGAMANGRAPMQHMPSMGLGSTSHLSRQDSETLRAMGVSSLGCACQCIFVFICVCVLVCTCANCHMCECVCIRVFETKNLYPILLPSKPQFTLQKICPPGGKQVHCILATSALHTCLCSGSLDTRVFPTSLCRGILETRVCVCVLCGCARA